MLYLGVKAALIGFPDELSTDTLKSSLKGAGFDLVPDISDRVPLSDIGLFVVFVSLPEQANLILESLPSDALKVAIVPNALSGDFALLALRAGYSNAFSLAAIDQDLSCFEAWLTTALRLCQAAAGGPSYQEQLENSIAELEEDQRAAYQVQKKLLPAALESINGLTFQYDLMPSLIVSGDFVDVISVNDSLTIFYLADVSGHGASSALVTVLLKNLMSRLVRNYHRRSSFDILSPKHIAERINKELVSLSLDKHLTIVICLFDAKLQTLLYTVAGHHPAPILITRDAVTELKCQSMAVGLFPNPIFSEASVVLPTDFTLVLCSDGVFDLLPEQSVDKKRKRLSNLVQSMANDFESLSDRLIRVHENSNERADDLTVMHVSRGKL